MPLSFGMFGGGGGTSSTAPSIRVEVAFGTDPNSPAIATPDWTPLVMRVMSIDLSRNNRTDELGVFQAGGATIALFNPDGMFNPTNPSSPYAGQLIPYRPIRIIATWGGVDYPLWQGYVERWPQSWTDPSLGISQIVCVDAFAALTQIGLDSVYAAEILSADPTVYYPLSEASGASAAGNQSPSLYPPAQIIHTKGRNSTPAAGTYAFGQTLNITGAAAQTGLKLVGNNNNLGGGVEDGYALNLPVVPIDWSGWTLELWCQIPKTPAQFSLLCGVTNANPPGGSFPADSAGSITIQPAAGLADTTLQIVTPDAVYLTMPLNKNLADNVIHHLILTYIPGVLTAAVDGVVTASSTVASSDASTVQSLIQLGASAINAATLPIAPLYDGNPLIGTIGHFALYPSSLTLAQIGGHYVAGATAFAGELSGDRAARLLAYGGWQSVLQDVQQGRSTMSPATGLAGTMLLAALQDCADAELGTLTVTADGKINPRSRDDRIYKTAPTIIFGSDVGAGEIPYNLPALATDFDPTLVVNDWQVSRPNGPTFESADPASIATNFPHVKQLTMNVDTDDQTRDASDWLLGREKNPHPRVETITVNAGNIDGNAMSNLWPSLLALDLHDRAGLRHRPVGAPMTSTDGFVEQLGHKIDALAGTWDVTTLLSPVLADYWIVEDPVQGFVDSTFVVAF